MILTIIGLLVLTACVGLVVWSGLYITDRVGNAYNTEDRVMGGLVGFGALLVALFLVAVWTGEIDFATHIPDGCYRVYNESDTSFIPSGNGTVTPIVSSERHFLPIACP